MDEPTNHLDVDGREELLNALNDYEGAVVLISHDRRVIEGCADRLFLVGNSKVQPFDGDLDDYRTLILSGDESPLRSAAAGKSISKSEQRRQAADRRLTLKPLKDEMQSCEHDVARLHAELERLDRALAAPDLFTAKPERGAELSKARADAVRRLEQAETRWITAAEKYEAAEEERLTR